MPREVVNDKAEPSLNVEISSVWQQISQELHQKENISAGSGYQNLLQHTRAEIAQIPPAAGASPAAQGPGPKVRPIEATQPMQPAFRRQYETEKDRWPDFFPRV